ncbi:hypothetical protein ACFQ67_27850 [Streptomyces sp. NPDC056488]|uniref:hypothetical protein n=1 Tax=Streptomyces sp. NPDC056488 TaxID=3345836 RepID=UPI0036B2A6E4
MEKFKVGDIVRITGSVMTGNIGTVVHLDQKHERYLVRVTDLTQNYFPESDLEPYAS